MDISSIVGEIFIKPTEIVSKKAVCAKGIFSFFCMLISGEFGLQSTLIFALFILMIVDYITGMLAAGVRRIKNLNNPQTEIKSKRHSIGIIKKISYLVTIGIALGFDWLIDVSAKHFEFQFYSPVMFGLLVSVWYIINEMISVLENLDEMGANVPAWLKKAMQLFKTKAETKAKSESDINSVE